MSDGPNMRRARHVAEQLADAAVDGDLMNLGEAHIASLSENAKLKKEIEMWAPGGFFNPEQDLLRRSHENLQAELVRLTDERQRLREALMGAEKVIRDWVNVLDALAKATKLEEQKDKHPWLGSARDWLSRHSALLENSTVGATVSNANETEGE